MKLHIDNPEKYSRMVLPYTQAEERLKVIRKELFENKKNKNKLNSIIQEKLKEVRFLRLEIERIDKLEKELEEEHRDAYNQLQKEKIEEMKKNDRSNR